MGLIKDRNGMDLTEAEDIKKRWQEYTELYKKDLHDQDNHDGVIIHLEPDTQESSPTPQFKSINSSALSFLYMKVFPTLTSIHDYRKNHSFN